jgi:imidazolonepropionase-like amidohydrolase
MKASYCRFLLIALLASPVVHAAEKIRYVILVDGGKQAGEQVVEHGDDGLTKVRFIFKDNGRGPELNEEFRVADDGTFSEYRVTGNSTFGAVVDDKFERKNNVASWASTSEKGSQKVSGTALYIPLNSSFAVGSASIAALAKRPDGKLPLLPAGTLTQRKLDEVDVTRDGKSQKVQLLALSGQGLTPSFVWATIGNNPRLFAIVVPGYLLAIEDGWQANGSVLDAHQKAAEAQLLKDMAAKLQKPMIGMTVIRNARVFDSETAKLMPASDVYVLRGKITAVLPAGSPARGADNEIDAAGRVLLPGLFDMHGHVGRWDGGLNLAAGVTTVRDMGNDNATLQQMIDETNAGQLLSPQIVPAGFLEGESPFSARNGFVIKNLQEAKDAIDWYAQHGYPQLKIYNSFPKDILKETVAYAHSRGLRVSGHIPVFLRAEEAVNAGYDEIQHINQVLLNFLVTPTTDTRTLERFILPAEKVGDLDFNSKPVKDFIALLKEKNVVIDPTVVTFEFLRQRDGTVPEAYAPVMEHMPIDLQRGFRVGTMNIPDDATAERYKKSYAKMLEFVGLMYKAGIPIVAGTDAISGFTLQSELEFYVNHVGMTPAQALQIATHNGALYSRTSNDRGSITPGKLADLVLIDGDPTTNIADIRKVAMVITQGKIISPNEVYETLGIKPFVLNPPALKAVVKDKVSQRDEAGGSGLPSIFGSIGHDHKE